MQIDRMNQAASALAKLRKGIKEKPSALKRASSQANLEIARAAWSAKQPADRKRA